MSNFIDIFNKAQRAAESGHQEYQGRNAAIVYVCFLALGWIVLTFFYVPVASDIIHLINDIFCGFFDVVFDREPKIDPNTYVKVIQDGKETFAPVENTPKGKGVSYAPVAVVAALFAYIAYQRYMANRAHGRHEYWGNTQH